MSKTFPLEPDLPPITSAMREAEDEAREVVHERSRNRLLRDRIADLERQLAGALRLLNFTPDQLELLVDPAKLAYVEWNLSSTYTLQVMCETYREGKMEVREAKRHDCGYALQRTLEIAERQMALAKVRGEALEHIFVTASERTVMFPADGHWLSVRDTAATAIAMTPEELSSPGEKRDGMGRLVSEGEAAERRSRALSSRGERE